MSIVAIIQKTLKGVVIVLQLTFLSLFCLPLTGCEQREITLRVDAGFDADDLSDDASIWYQRMWSGINHPEQLVVWTDYAASNDTYKYGRQLNSHISGLLHVLRVTGDPALLEEVDRLTEIMRSKLKDWSITSFGNTEYEADGFLNWQNWWNTDWNGTDSMPMDEMMAHSLVASFAYAFHFNRDLDSRYAERADFWLDYLKNHFEAKWRKRNATPVGNFLDKDLAHPYVQWIRYHYYMYQLTGEQQYINEVQRRIKIFKKHVIEAQGGAAYVWDHRMTELGEHDSWGCQPFIYGRQTIGAIVDLNLENPGLFDDEFVARMAGTVTRLIMDNGSVDFAGDVCGGSAVAGLKASGYKRESRTRMGYTISFVEAGAWDKSGKILRIAQEVYTSLEVQPEVPRRTHIATAMTFAEIFRRHMKERKPPQ